MDDLKKNICCVFNFASHYRKSIYQMMDLELGCDFFIGDKVRGNIKPMDYKSLNGYKKSLKNIPLFGKYYWQSGVINILFKPYKQIVMIGEPYCISNWIILAGAKLLGKETYTWTHGWYGRESTIKRFVKIIFFKLAHHVFLYGDYAKELMIKEGFSPDKLTCIYNSLDFDNQIAIRKKLKPGNIFSEHFKNNNRNLIFVGRLTQVKKLDLLLEAMLLLKKKSNEFNLTIIGEGETKIELGTKCTKLGLEDNVWFYGESYDDDELSGLIYNADLCVSPGNVGLTAIHAMTFGTPVLTHDNFPYQGPEFESIIDGQTGTFFKYNDPISLADKMLDWFLIAQNREIIRQNCYRIIDLKYNPHYQMRVIKEELLDK